jgi:hypothetical protein
VRTRAKRGKKQIERSEENKTSGARTFNLPGGARLPALANDEVTSTRERHGVAVAAGVKVDAAARLVVLVVVLAGLEDGLGRANDKVGRVGLGGGRGRGEDGRECRGGEGQVGKGDHVG